MLRLGMSGLVLVWTLGACAAIAAAQDAPPAPEEPPAPEPVPPAPPPPDPAPDPGVPPKAPPWVESQPPPPPADGTAQPADGTAQPAQPPGSAPAEPAAQPTTRYEGQVGPDESAPGYADDFESDDTQYDDDKKDGEDFDMPGFSIRMDPLNWLIEGRLGFELEMVAWKFISVELVPVFVVNDEPPSFNFSGRDDPISQHSNGLGPIAGSSIGAGFWLSGQPFEGYVLRAILTNYAFTYRASDRVGTFDEVDFTERRLMAFFGSHSRFGAFTLAGGLGLAYELNQQTRCFGSGRAPDGGPPAGSSCEDEDEQLILTDREPVQVEPGGEERWRVTDLNGGLHPVYIEARFSLGVAFD